MSKQSQCHIAFLFDDIPKRPLVSPRSSKKREASSFSLSSDEEEEFAPILLPPPCLVPTFDNNTSPPRRLQPRKRTCPPGLIRQENACNLDAQKIHLVVSDDELSVFESHSRAKVLPPRG